MPLRYKTPSAMVLMCILFVMPFFVSCVSAQTPSNYYVTVKPTTPDSPIYTAVGQNWTVSFEALWSYGVDNGKPLRNATAIIDVTNNDSEIVDEISVKTNGAGVISFNYSSLTADTLTFTPVKLTSQDGKEWATELVDPANNVYGLQSEAAVIWWDTFHVSLVSSDTSALGYATVTVKVTYLLLPEEGLTLPEWATYSNQTYLPKTVQDADVTINGVKAEETQEPGIFLADVPIWLPTTYIHVTVSREAWVTTHTGFDFTHQANQPVWMYAAGLGSVFSFAALLIFVFIFRKENNPLLLRHNNYPFYGSALLAITSIISLYWGLVGLDGYSHGFDWILLAALGTLSFASGIAGILMLLRKKYQILAIIAVTVPMFVNVVAIKSSLDMYQLTIPWLILLASLFLSAISGYFICNSDTYFHK